MPALPRDPGFDGLFAFRADPYGFVSERCRRLQVDAFETRIGLQRTICLSGAEAAALFYDTDRFERAASLPGWIGAVLFGKGGVQGLDGEAHRYRKAMYLQVTSPERIARLVELVAEVAEARIERWAAAERVVLYDEFQSIFCEATCGWAGVPLPAADVDRRAADMSTLFQWATSIGPKHWWARWVRVRLERWIAGLVDDVRGGRRRLPEGCAVDVVLRHRDLRGEPLDTHTAAVEILNVIRPTIAVAVFAVFGALALERHPECRDRLGDAAYREWFALEVRRFFPFFPVIAARVRTDFEWKGYDFPRGRRALFDVFGTNHDPRVWDAPESFRPERFREHVIGPFEYVPQGGGDTATNHRCPGERIAIELVKLTSQFLAERIDYRVPEQNLDVDRSRTPALPHSGFVVTNVAPRV
jgi:fatty-acid peroxygenase